MDKKIHKKVNVLETICVLVGIVCMSTSAMLRGSMIQGLSIYQTMLMIIGLVAEIVVVSVELMLFHLENKKMKFLTVAYYVMEVVTIMLMNARIPFSGLLVLTLFSIAKNIYRVQQVEVIYKPLGYYELCKKFGIKVKKPRKARSMATKKNAVPVKERKSRSAAKSGEPNYA